METKPYVMTPNDRDLRAAALYALVFFREWERGHGAKECDVVALEHVQTWYPYMSD